MSKITGKQGKFIQELIKGKSQREAYKIAYPKSLKWADNTIDANACRLMSNSKVLARYNELFKNPKVTTRYYKLNLLIV